MKMVLEFELFPFQFSRLKLTKTNLVRRRYCVAVPLPCHTGTNTGSSQQITSLQYSLEISFTPLDHNKFSAQFLNLEIGQIHFMYTNCVTSAIRRVSAGRSCKLFFLISINITDRIDTKNQKLGTRMTLPFVLNAVRSVCNPLQFFGTNKKPNFPIQSTENL